MSVRPSGPAALRFRRLKKLIIRRLSLFVLQTDASVLIPRLPVDEERHRFHDWDILYQKSHILHSMCNNKGVCQPGQPGCCELCL